MNDIAAKRLIAQVSGMKTGAVRWYKRNIGDTQPSAAINKEFTYTADAVYKANPNVKVAQQSSLWTDKGTHPILIRRGFAQPLGQFGEIIKGDFHGTAYQDLNITIEDHLIDAKDNEYKVTHISDSQSGVFKSFTLEYLP